MTAVHFKLDHSADASTFRFVVPKFGSRCVCCNAEAQGQTQGYDPSSGQVRAPTVLIPVCAKCTPHALDTPKAANVVAALIILGGMGAVLALFANNADPDFRLGLGLGGLAMAGAGVAYGFMRTAMQKRESAIPGHSAGLYFQVLPGLTVIFTENEVLVEELLALNPTAQRSGPKEQSA